MSFTETHVAVIGAEENRRTNDNDEIADALVQGGPGAIEALIARVLGRAHRKAERFNDPDEARAIFHVAHSFADELVGTDPQFDRRRFIETVTNSSF